MSSILVSVWQILVLGIVAGVGLPLLFAFGVRGLAVADGETKNGTGGKNPLGNVVAGVCFLVVIVGVIVGLMVMIAPGYGKKVSFDHVYPTLVSAKK
jgi:hypothetical protein